MFKWDDEDDGGFVPYDRR